MAETLSFSLVPDPGKRVRFDALEAAIQEVRGLLRDVDRSIFRAEGVTRQRPWYVRRLASNNSTSSTVVLEADDVSSALDRKTGETLLAGLAEVVEGSSDAPPPFFSDAELQGLIAIRRRVLAKDLQRIEVGQESQPAKVQIRPSIEDQVNRILRGSVEALGSLDGELDAINTRRQPYFTMWEVMSGQPVRVTFDADQLDEVKRLLHLPVRVSGLVSYFANGRPRAILRMERIKGLSGPLEPGRQYWGSLPNLSRGEDTSAALRRGFGG